MTADPRVEAVMAVMRRDGWTWCDYHEPVDDPGECSDCDEAHAATASRAVAALDAYDGPKFSSVVHECCERPTEVDLRKRIAQEIEAAHRTAPDRAVIAEAAIARVRSLCDEWDDDGDCALLYGGDAARKIRAALDGEA